MRRFSSTVSSGNTQRFSGTSVTPRPAIAWAGARQLIRAELDRAGPGRHQADDRGQRGRLARAVAAEQAGHLAVPRGQAHAVQHLAGAVARMHVAQHQIGPGRGRAGPGVAGGALRLRNPAQVGVLHPGVHGDRIRRPLGQHGALGEHADLLRDVLDQAHPVLDEQHRQPLPEPPDQYGHPLGLGQADAGRGLVQAQHDRIAGQRHRHLDPAPVGLGQRAAGPVPVGRAEPHLGQQLSAALPGPLARGPAQPQPDPAAQLGPLQRQLDTLPRGHAVEYPADLERPDQPEAHPGHCGEAGDVPPGQRDLALVGLDQPGNAVEHGGLPGAVRPDDRVHAAVGHGQLDAIQHPQFAEPLGQPGYLQDRASCRAPVQPPAPSRIAPVAPPGSSSTRATNSAPKYTCQLLAKLDIR